MNYHADWSYPTEVRFGAGRISELPEASKILKISRPLLITDNIIQKLPFAQEIQENLESFGLLSSIYSDVQTNPNDTHLANALEVFKTGNHDGVIALGGGSVIDLAKLVALMALQTRPIWDFEDVENNWMLANADMIFPIIAIPTTAGTGSEVGRAGVLVNSDTTRKVIIFHPKILPSIVIGDPETTVGMPPNITAGTGMDALAHCLEAYCAPSFHPMSEGIALQGIFLIKENLEQAFQDGGNISARANMLAAAMMGATAFQRGLGAMHAIAHPIGAIFNTHHGMTNAILMPFVLDWNRKIIENRIDSLTRYIDIPGGFDGFRDWIIKLRKSLGVPDGLANIGVERNKFDAIAKMSLLDPSGHGNPRKLNYDGTLEILEAAF